MSVENVPPNGLDLPGAYFIKYAQGITLGVDTRIRKEY
jgi:hypothetical protein